MAIITFSNASPFPSTPFPTSALRERLTVNLSAYRWQCGEQDFGGKTEIGRFPKHMLISGRGFDTIVFTELRAVDAVMPGAAPPHQWHLNVSPPTTEIQLVADRITVTICTILMTIDQLDSRCRLHPGGDWLTAGDMELVLESVLGGEPLSPATVPASASILANEEMPEIREIATDVAAAHEAEAAQAARGAAPSPLRRVGGFGRKGL